MDIVTNPASRDAVLYWNVLTWLTVRNGAGLLKQYYINWRNATPQHQPLPSPNKQWINSIPRSECVAEIEILPDHPELGKLDEIPGMLGSAEGVGGDPSMNPIDQPTAINKRHAGKMCSVSGMTER